MRPQPPVRRGPSRQLVYALAALALVVVAGVAGWALLGRSTSTASTASTSSTPANFESLADEAVQKTAAAIAGTIGESIPIYRELGQAVANIAAKGAQVGYYLGTVDGEQLEAYNADTVFYGASSIKGPFVISELAAGASLQSQLSNVTYAIEDSDNSAYYALRNAWGYDALNEWLTDVGVDTTTQTTSYAYYSPRELAGLWTKCWDYLKEDTSDTATIDEIFSNPLNSTFSELGADETWSKPGWISGSLNSTVDAGLVKYGDKVYVIAVMTSAGEDFSDVATIVSALDKLAVLDASRSTE